MPLCDVLFPGPDESDSDSGSSSGSDTSAEAVRGEAAAAASAPAAPASDPPPVIDMLADVQKKLAHELQTRPARLQRARNCATRRSEKAGAAVASQKETEPIKGSSTWFHKLFFTSVPYTGSDDQFYRPRAAYSAFEAFTTRLIDLLSGPVKSLITRVTMDDVSKRLTDAVCGGTVFSILNMRQRLLVRFEGQSDIDIPVHVPSIILDDAGADSMHGALRTWVIWHGGESFLSP